MFIFILEEIGVFNCLCVWIFFLVSFVILFLKREGLKFVLLVIFLGLCLVFFCFFLRLVMWNLYVVFLVESVDSNSSSGNIILYKYGNMIFMMLGIFKLERVCLELVLEGFSVYLWIDI